MANGHRDWKGIALLALGALSTMILAAGKDFAEEVASGNHVSRSEAEEIMESRSPYVKDRTLLMELPGRMSRLEDRLSELTTEVVKLHVLMGHDGHTKKP